jgi:hypothetical protein
MSTLLVCRFCMSPIGVYNNSAEKVRLETKHICGEKLGLHKPAVSVPFN